MGAYYEATIVGSKKTLRFDPHDLNSGLKLLEHSYIGNIYTERIMHKLLTKARLGWVCDYFAGEYQWSNVVEDHTFDLSAPIMEKDYIILNHTKKVYIHIPLQQELASKDWNIHPIPILCNSNDYHMGGGDYGKDPRRSTWFMDELEVVYTPNSLYQDVTDANRFIE